MQGVKRGVRRALGGATLAAMSLGALPAVAEVMRITTQFPATNMLTRNLEAFGKRVEEVTEGRVEVQVFPAAQLFKDHDAYNAVATGAIEAGNASTAYVASSVPAADVFYLPFYFNTEEKLKAAALPGAPIRSLLDEAMETSGVVPLYWQYYGASVFASNAIELHEPADLEGVKVRTFGRTVSYMVQSMGGVPMVISAGETYLAMQRGIVDALMTAIPSINSRRFYEVSTSVTLTRHAQQFFPVVVNAKFWGKISVEDREAIMAVAQEAEADTYAQMRVFEKEGIAQMATKTKVIELTPEQVVAWREASQPVVDEYLKLSGPLGEKIVAEAKKLQ
ncbi:MAG: TRAP transporter substrate-binding protein DctP [Roseovarius sp.]|nr:TRAP transporter substrate-binding protein DctP [Roseovarius sp.]